MGMITAEEAIRAYHSGKKTPYQLDLEVKGRKPSIVPKVGNRVKIKSREWYEKWKDEDGVVWVDNAFVRPMADFCGKILTVEAIHHSYYILEGITWYWNSEMFEEVYPVQEQLISKFPRIDLSCHLPLESPLQARGSELVLSKEEQEKLKGQFFSLCSEREKELLKKQSSFAAKVEETAKRLAAYSLVQGMTAKPKLKQIKTTHLIKLKKL